MEELIRRRKAARISIVELARARGVDPSAVCHAEDTKSRPPGPLVMKRYRAALEKVLAEKSRDRQLSLF